MSNSDIKLNFFPKYYEIFDGQVLIICDVKNKEDKNFHIQLRFLQQNSQKINLLQIETVLKRYIEKLSSTNKLLFNNKIGFLNDLKKLEFDINLIEIIKNNSRYKIDNYSKLIKEHDKNLIALFCLGSVANIKFGYEIPEDLSRYNTPLYCLSIFSNKKLAKKIYLFPTSSESLKNAVSILKENPSTLKNLEIPYIEYIPSQSTLNLNYDEAIQTRINLQTIISEILTHLEKPKCFRKNGTEKAGIFRNLAKRIAEGEALDNISSKLNEHDTWKLLAQHRDPWGFLSFFKGKTHSLAAWQALKDEISNFSNRPTTPTLFN